jgi:hypothetical protein
MATPETAKIIALVSEIARLTSAIQWERETIAARDARIAELEEALRPFAGLIPREWLENQFDDSKPVFAFSDNVIRVGDFVKAIAAANAYLAAIGGDDR